VILHRLDGGVGLGLIWSGGRVWAVFGKSLAML
jgi:hypothetical protein